MASFYTVYPGKLTLADIKDIIHNHKKIVLSAEALTAVRACRHYLDEKMRNSDEAFYGINTGFGDLCNVKISKGQIEDLQKNLVMSHACGMGNEVPQEVVKLMLLLKVQSLAYGHSGVAEDTINRLIWMFNENILPVVYEQGSLGASGDLAPLAHLSLPLLGMGEVWIKDEKKDAAAVLTHHDLQPLQLKSKEGLALLNGTQFMSAYGCFILLQMHQYLELNDLIAAVALDAFDCKNEPFNHLIHQVRNHGGQIKTAKNILNFLEGSQILNQEKHQVQDAYSFRCIPQVHGATRDVVDYLWVLFEKEISGVTDNPNVFWEEDLILSGGNFHGQPLAMALDYLAIAIAELGSISERRTYKMLSGTRGLPPFLTSQSGLHSGLMIPQYTAASIVSENKQFCTPASVDSIVSSNGQEDHVSMGANAATKCLRVFRNFEKLLSIELLTATQALEFRRPLRSSAIIEDFVAQYRNFVKFDDRDRPFYTDLNVGVKFLRNFEWKY